VYVEVWDSGGTKLRRVDSVEGPGNWNEICFYYTIDRIFLYLFLLFFSVFSWIEFSRSLQNKYKKKKKKKLGLPFSTEVLMKMKQIDFRWKNSSKLDWNFFNYSIKLIFIFKINNQFRRQFGR
jgi:hypothetical protein